MGPNQDRRHKILLNVVVVDLPLLYDTGAAITCLTLAMFQKHFSHHKRCNHSTGAKGAGNNDLGLYRVYTLRISYKDKKIEGQLMVCSNLDVDLLGIDVMKKSGITYFAKSPQVFSIASMPDVWQTTM